MGLFEVGCDLDEKSSPKKRQRQHAATMSQYLKRWRELLGFTLHGVSGKIGRHFTTVQKWESGINAVSTKDLEQLGKVYGVPWMALTFDPKDEQTTRRLRRVYHLVTKASPEAVDALITAWEIALQQGDGDPPRQNPLDGKAKAPRQRRKKS